MFLAGMWSDSQDCWPGWSECQSGWSGFVSSAGGVGFNLWWWVMMMRWGWVTEQRPRFMGQITSPWGGSSTAGGLGYHLMVGLSVGDSALLYITNYITLAPAGHSCLAWI